MSLNIVHKTPYSVTETSYTISNSPVSSFDSQSVPIKILKPSRHDGGNTIQEFPCIVWPQSAYPLNAGEPDDYYHKKSWLERICKSGFVIIWTQYRGTGGITPQYFALESILHDELEDVKAVGDWAKNQTYINSDYVFVAGSGRGGNIALYLSNNFPNDFAGFAGLCSTPNIGHSLQFWPTTVEMLNVRQRVIGSFGGDPKTTEEYNLISPSYNISSITKPLLMINGELDPLVEKSAPYLFYKDLVAAEKDVELYMYKNKGHDFMYGYDSDSNKLFVTPPWLYLLQWLRDNTI